LLDPFSSFFRRFMVWHHCGFGEPRRVHLSPCFVLGRLLLCDSSTVFHRTCRLGFPGPHNAFETGARIEHVVGFRVPTCFPSHLGVGSPGCESRGFVLPGIAPLRRCPHIQGGEAASPPRAGESSPPGSHPFAPRGRTGVSRSSLPFCPFQGLPSIRGGMPSYGFLPFGHFGGISHRACCACCALQILLKRVRRGSSG